MAKRIRPDFRIASKELYAFYWREDEVNKRPGISFGCTNRTVLSERTGIPYKDLRRIFTARGKMFYEDRERGFIIIRIMVSDIVKGRQSLSRRGRGGNLLRRVSGY